MAGKRKVPAGDGPGLLENTDTTSVPATVAPDCQVEIDLNHPSGPMGPRERLTDRASTTPGIEAMAHALARRLLDEERRDGGPTGPRVRLTDQLAALGGSSGRTVRRAKRIRDQAPDLWDAVKADRLSLRAAERELLARLGRVEAPMLPSSETMDAYLAQCDDLESLRRLAGRLDDLTQRVSAAIWHRQMMEAGS